MRGRSMLHLDLLVGVAVQRSADHSSDHPAQRGGGVQQIRRLQTIRRPQRICTADTRQRAQRVRETVERAGRAEVR